MIELGLDGLNNFRIAMAKAGDSRTTGAIQIAFGVLIDQIATFATHSDRRQVFGMTWEDVGHKPAFLPFTKRRHLTAQVQVQSPI